MKGSKTCPNCNSGVGPRTKICACGHNFEFKNKSTVVNKSVELPKSFSSMVKKDISIQNNNEGIGVSFNVGMRNVIVPAGKCPFEMKDHSDENIKEWVGKIREHGIKQNANYLPSVFVYWAKMYCVDQFTDEGKQILNKIKNYATVEN